MLLFELFNKTDIGNVVSMSEEFYASKTIGGREIRFAATLLRKGHWEIEFAEENRKSGKTYHKMSGSGNEFEVMAFVMSAFEKFMSKYEPNRVEFTADITEDSRIRLYRRMIKRFAKNYLVQEFEVGMPKPHQISFDLIKKT